jgi:hypothetical protein
MAVVPGLETLEPQEIAEIFARVTGPTLPTGSMPLALWNAETADAVMGPNFPSETPEKSPWERRKFCKLITSVPEEPSAITDVKFKQVVVFDAGGGGGGLLLTELPLPITIKLRLLLTV